VHHGTDIARLQAVQGHRLSKDDSVVLFDHWNEYITGDKR
jgi:hypothetical protein